jgi:hypothetical protein
VDFNQARTIMSETRGEVQTAMSQAIGLRESVAAAITRVETLQANGFKTINIDNLAVTLNRARVEIDNLMKLLTAAQERSSSI